MEGKGRFGTQYEENGIRSDCRLKLQGMSDLFVHECVDIAWDDYLLDDDRMVPHHGSKRLADHFTLGENNKRCRHELASNSNKYVDQRREKNSALPLSETSNMSDNDSWSSKLRGPFTYGCDKELIKEAPGLVSDSTMPSSHGLKSNNRYINSTDLPKHGTALNNSTSLADENSTNFPIGDVNNTGKDLGFFGHGQNKDSSDLLYYDWSEIENFDDIDRMFRSDSRLGIEVCREDELSWLSSADDIGGPQDALKSDATFSCPDPSKVKTISENHDFLNGYSPNNFAMSDVPSRYEECSWTSEKSDSYTSILTGPDTEDSKDGFIPPKQGIGCNAKLQPRISTSSHFSPGDAAVMIEHKNQMKLQSRSDSLSQISELQNDIMNPCSGLTLDQAVHVQQQQHASVSDSSSCLENTISNIHLKDSHLSDQSLVNMEQSIVSETNDVSISSRDSHHASGQLQYMGDFSGPPLKDTSLVVCGQREKLASCQGILSSGHDSLKNGRVAVQASISDPGLVGKYENHCDPQGVSSAFAAEMGSSNMQQNSTMVPNIDDISLEAASFRQLQFVTKQLDLRTKLCIRDSLYRLAHSAEQRRRNLNLNGSFGDERDAAAGASEAEVTESCTSLMDMETDTNPIDRSVAHLLFHRPSDSSSFISPGVVHGSVASLPALSDSLVSEEEG